MVKLCVSNIKPSGTGHI